MARINSGIPFASTLDLLSGNIGFDQFSEDFFQDPLAGGIIGYVLGGGLGAAFGTGAGLFGRDIARSNEEAAALREDLTKQGRGLLERFEETEFDPGIFDVGQAQLEAFRNNPFVQGEVRDFVTPEDFLRGVDLPETDLSDVLGARLSGIAETSRSRESLQRQNLASQASTFGGLENLRRASDSLAFGEGATRGLLSSQARAETRAEELAAQEFVAGLQSQAATNAEQINTALEKFLLTTELEKVGAAAGDDVLAAAFELDKLFKETGLSIQELGVEAGAFAPLFLDQTLDIPNYLQSLLGD